MINKKKTNFYFKKDKIIKFKIPMMIILSLFVIITLTFSVRGAEVVQCPSQSGFVNNPSECDDPSYTECIYSPQESYCYVFEEDSCDAFGPCESGCHWDPYPFTYGGLCRDEPFSRQTCYIDFDNDGYRGEETISILLGEETCTNPRPCGSYTDASPNYGGVSYPDFGACHNDIRCQLDPSTNSRCQNIVSIMPNDNQCKLLTNEQCSIIEQANGGCVPEWNSCGPDSNEPGVYFTYNCAVLSENEEDCNAIPNCQYYPGDTCIDKPIYSEKNFLPDSAEEDCNDNNPDIHPGATEICDDEVDNNCNGFIDCDDDDCDCSSCTQNNEACSTGAQCCDGLCVNGYCRPSCSSYGGFACSNNNNNYNSFGACTSISPTCINNEIAKYGSQYYNDCYSISDGTIIIECDTNPLGGYGTNGICTINHQNPTNTGHVNCKTNNVCLKNNRYWESPTYCDDKNPCDTDVSNGNFVKDSIVCDNECVGTSASNCCNDDHCQSGNVCDLTSYICGPPCEQGEYLSCAQAPNDDQCTCCEDGKEAVFYDEIGLICEETITFYCGDGIITNPNSYGINEQCEIIEGEWGNCIPSNTFPESPGTNQDRCQCQEGYIPFENSCIEETTPTYCGDNVRQWPNSNNQYEECDNVENCLSNCQCADGYNPILGRDTNMCVEDIPGNENCYSPGDEDGNGESDFDNSDRKHGDIMCPIEITSISLSQSTITSGETVDIICHVSPAYKEYNSIYAFIDLNKNNQFDIGTDIDLGWNPEGDSWNDDKSAVIFRDRIITSSNNIVCDVYNSSTEPYDRSYQTGTPKSALLTVNPSTCSGKDFDECKQDCKWIEQCRTESPQYSGGDDRCVEIDTSIKYTCSSTQCEDEADGSTEFENECDGTIFSEQYLNTETCTIETRDSVDCDDGVFCNGEEICLQSGCSNGMPPSCEFGCDEENEECFSEPETECTSDNDCDDDLFCTINSCDEGQCVEVNRYCEFGCDEENEECFSEPETECTSDNDCDDGLFCTINSCDEGQCVEVDRYCEFGCDEENNQCSSESEICNEVGDEDGNNESDYDSSDGKHGDIMCPVGVEGAIFSRSNYCPGENIVLSCFSTQSNINSIEAYYVFNGNREKCTFDKWKENRALFNCQINPSVSGNILGECQIIKSRSYAIEGQQSASVTLEQNSDCCSSYENESTCINEGCNWIANFCDDNKYYSPADPDGVCISGDATYICNDNKCDAECDSSTNSICPGGTDGCYGEGMDRVYKDYYQYNNNCSVNCLFEGCNRDEEHLIYYDRLTEKYLQEGCNVCGDGVLDGDEECDSVDNCVNCQCEEGYVQVSGGNNCVLDEGCTSDNDCDDGLFCTINSCDEGQCVEVNRDCDDGIDCTIDSCDEDERTCIYDASTCGCFAPSSTDPNKCNIILTKGDKSSMEAFLNDGGCTKYEDDIFYACCTEPSCDEQFSWTPIILS